MTDDKTIRRQVLEEAADLIDGDRNVTYGTPTQNFTNIAEMLTTRFGHKLRPGQKITAADVADIMVLVKICRNIAQTKRDNFVDIAGYAACGYEAHESAQRPKTKVIEVNLNEEDTSKIVDAATGVLRRMHNGNLG